MEQTKEPDSAVSDTKFEVKMEPPDEDIQDYAEDTMNELLAIYGYNEKVEHGVTQNIQLGPKYRRDGERGLRKRLQAAAPSSSRVGGDGGNITPLSGSEALSAEEDPASPSSSHDTPEMADAVVERTVGEKDQIVCAWCKSPGLKHYTLNTQTDSKAFCSERCFASCRRAYFKRNKVCDWCRHTRHLQDYIYLLDGDRRLQFCSSKCMNQYKIDLYYKENPGLARKVKSKRDVGGGGSKSNGSTPVSPTLQQQSVSGHTSPDTASQNASLHNSQPSPSDIPSSGVFQHHSSSSTQSMLGLPQLRPSGVFGVQTVVPQPMSFRQMVPQLPLVQVMGAGGVPVSMMQGFPQASSLASHKLSSRLAQQQWGDIPGIQSGAGFKKIKPKPQSSSTTTLASSTVTSDSSNVPSSSARKHRHPHHRTPSSTSVAGGSAVPPVTVMVPHPLFIPIPVPIPIPIPVCREAYEAAMDKLKESQAAEAAEAAEDEEESPVQETVSHEDRHPKKRIAEAYTNGSSLLPSTRSTGAFVPYRSHRADMHEDLSNSTDNLSMDAMLSSSLQTSLNLPHSSASSSASEALESRLRHQTHRHPAHISTATVEAMHRSINSRMMRHKCLQRSASMDLSFGRYNTLSAITDFLGEKRGFSPVMHASTSRRDLVADGPGLSSPRSSHSNLPTKGAGELSPSVREALRCHLTRRLSQSALNLTDVGRGYPQEDQLRRSRSLCRLQEDTDPGGSGRPDMDAISSHTSLEKLADTSDSSDHFDSSQPGGLRMMETEEGGEAQPAIKRRCLGRQHQID